jgi:hypothetical protein
LARKYWICPKCGVRYERTKQKCSTCSRSRPKPRVAPHAKTLRDDSYDVYLQAARDIHGVSDESCCVCGRERSQERRHDRDHGHLRGDPAYGKPRGLACVSCNRLMPRELDLARALLIVQYLTRVDWFYGVRNEREAA